MARQVLRIGGSDAEGPSALGSVLGAAFVDFGSHLAVIDGLARQIKVFALDGTFIRSMGKRGEGPGENRVFRGVRERGEGGICAWDVQAPSVLQYDSLGQLLSQRFVDLTPVEAIRPILVGFLPDCSFVVQDRQYVPGLAKPGEKGVPGPISRDTVRFFLYDNIGQNTRLLSVREGGERFWTRVDRSWFETVPIFGLETFGVLVGEELWVGISEKAQWARVSIDGELIDVETTAIQPRQVTNEWIALERERRLLDASQSRSLSGPGLAKVIRERRSAVRAAFERDSLPVFDDLVSSLDGALWMRLAPAPDEERVRWVRIERGRPPTGVLSLDRSVEVLTASEEYIVLLERDPFDAPVVRVLRWSIKY